jgi:hypothetical protein
MKLQFGKGNIAMQTGYKHIILPLLQYSGPISIIKNVYEIYIIIYPIFEYVV